MQCQGSANNIFRGNDLLKLHDYLAMRKPIVRTDIGGVNDLRDVSRVAQRPFNFLKEMEKALQSDTNSEVIKRRNVAMKNSWNNRIKELEQLIRNELSI